MPPTSRRRVSPYSMLLIRPTCRFPSPPAPEQMEDGSWLAWHTSATALEVAPDPRQRPQGRSQPRRLLRVTASQINMARGARLMQSATAARVAYAAHTLAFVQASPSTRANEQAMARGQRAVEVVFSSINRASSRSLAGPRAKRFMHPAGPHHLQLRSRGALAPREDECWALESSRLYHCYPKTTAGTGAGTSSRARQGRPETTRKRSGTCYLEHRADIYIRYDAPPGSMRR